VSVLQGVSSVQLDFGLGAFNDVPRYLAISAKCGAEASYTALMPRQALTVAPFATTAFNTPFAWSLNGNTGTTPATQFIGTTDNQPFEVRVNNLRALRIEPQTNLTFGTVPNIIGGGHANTVVAGVFGATIAGGGATLDSAQRHQVAGNFSTIGGGRGNTTNGEDSTISGERGHTANNGGTVGGGRVNTASGAVSTIGGGQTNTASNDYATVGGGESNTASSYLSFAAGRRAQADDLGAFVWADSQDADIFSPGVNTFSAGARRDLAGDRQRSTSERRSGWGRTTRASARWTRRGWRWRRSKR
jgi:hypothetical protein